MRMIASITAIFEFNPTGHDMINAQRALAPLALAPFDDDTPPTTLTRGTREASPPRRTGRVEHLEAQVAGLLDRMKIAVIHGGDKSNAGAVIHQTANTRSWKSYRSVAEDIGEALTRLGAKTVHIMADDMTLGENLRRAQIDMAWLNTGGVQGYSPMSHAAAMLEMFGIPYVGHDPLAAGMLDNKLVFKRELQALGVRNAPFVGWHPSRGPADPSEGPAFAKAFANYEGPFVVKPVSGRASLHVHVVNDRAGLAAMVDQVFRATNNHVLIEAFLPGREFCIAVCGGVVAAGRRLTHHPDAFVFSPAERVLAAGERIFTSMDHQPITVDRVHLLEGETERGTIAQLHAIARTVFMEMNLGTLIRLDLRMGPDGELYVLEANPKPDLAKPTSKKTSIVCVGLDLCGMDYDDLILSLIAERIDLVFRQGRGSPHHLIELLG